MTKGSTYKLKYLVFAISIILCSTCFTGCSQESTGTLPVSQESALYPSAPGDRVLGNSYVTIDVSNSSAGYMSVKYLGSSSKVKLQMQKSGETYTYDLVNEGDYAVFPFSAGSGGYSIGIYENIAGTQYAQVCSEYVNVTLDSETSPFLYPNYYVNYTPDSEIVALTLNRTDSCETQLDVVTRVFDYVTRNIDYDYDLANSVSTGYVPNIDNILDTKKGICFDYASLMTAMLRIKNIPTKLEVGYSGDLYHAWISVYVPDTGWIDDIIEFNGTDWTLMDPTFAAAGSTPDSEKYVGSQEGYHAIYYY